MGENLIVEEVAGLYQIIRLRPFRHTPGVSFDIVPKEALPRIDAIDRVIHTHGASSPGPVGDVTRPWYMHPHQADNLVVLHGTRYVELFSKKHGAIVSFTVTPDRIERDGKVVAGEAAMLVWPTLVFHRIQSDKETGSASLNFAVHYPGFDIRTNFNIYDLDPESGRFSVLRQGHLDQV